MIKVTHFVTFINIYLFTPVFIIISLNKLGSLRFLNRVDNLGFLIGFLGGGEGVIMLTEIRLFSVYQ